MLPLNFSNFCDVNNPSILWSFSPLLPKASASAFYCFQICKILAIYHVIIIFKLTLQQVVFVIELNKVRNFCPHLSGFFIPFLYLEIYNKNLLWRKSIQPSSSARSLYFSQGHFTNWNQSITVYYYIVKK